MKGWLQRFFAGRYGVDELSRFLTGLAMVTLILSCLIRNGLVGILFWLLTLTSLTWNYYRMFSRKVDRRRAENSAYLTLRYRLTGRLSGWRQRIRQKKYYRFYKCPGCGVTTRVPKGKGRIRVTCPKCGESFIRKS